LATIAAGNEEAVEAWNGVLFDRFLQYRHIFTAGLGAHGDAAMLLHPPPAGGRALDIGCGFGDTTQQLARLIGDAGEAVGIDAAPRFIELAEREAAEAGAKNVRFLVADPEASVLEEGFDYAFSRMGTMFFANPVAALRNIRSALVPRGQLNMVVWRRKLENEWAFRAEQVVEGFLEHTDPDDTDEPTCGPGPFSMANADTVSMQLRGAGFCEIDFRRSDLPMLYGRDVDEAVSVAMSLGPAGEIIRLAGERGEELRPQIVEALRELMGEYTGDDGAVRIEASCWLVSARVPAA
jgi:SAM-dependent methyltransferase